MIQAGVFTTIVALDFHKDVLEQDISSILVLEQGKKAMMR